MKTTKKENKPAKLIIKAVNAVVPVLEVVGALLGLAILLGLAYQGAQKYLANMSDDAQKVVAVLVVVGLAYIISLGFKRIFK